MPFEKPKKKMGRPFKEINWALIEKKIEAGCNAREIAGSIPLDLTLFYNKFKERYKKPFSEYSDQLRVSGDGNIRLAQYVKALSGNVPMLVLLGRERLGQSRELSINPQADLAVTLMHENMLLKAEMAKLKESLGINESETKQELCGSNPSF